MTTPRAGVYRNDSDPSWGLGLVVEEQGDRLVMVFEHGGRKTFIKSKAKALAPVELGSDEFAALEARLQGKHSRTSGQPKSKKAAPKKAIARFASFEEQLKAFEAIFEGGFEGERFIKEERGAEGATGKAGQKAAGIALARAELAAERFASGSTSELFEGARRVLGATTMVFPIEGAIPFNGIAEEDRPGVIAALKDLLHGQDEYGARLERFAASMNLKEKSGKARRVSWPLATLFGGLYAPEEHTCVKPTYFAAQGTTIGVPVQSSQPVTAQGYRQFFEVVKQTQKRLVDAGHRPRDFVDVYAFISRTHAEKPAA